ncbi:MAG: helix-turn-helix domain-containing protein, partial [Eubacteriales bacterium]|nr:helix-turn-helix domain-containing protein [Eubacteriales bacterium]
KTYIFIFHFLSIFILTFTPGNTDVYQNYFEETTDLKHFGYFILMLGLRSYDSINRSVQMERLEKSVRYSISRSILYEENGILIILVRGYRKNEIRQWLQELYEKEEALCAGMGSVVQRICDVHRSYREAGKSYQLAKSTGLGEIQDYDELGIYKILSDIKEPFLYPEFVEETLGPLLRYDEENGTNYVKILETYFENECNGIQTASSLFFHKNTMTYKLNKIKEILGYDILTNKNRVKIMVSLYIIRMGMDFFH